MRRAALWMLAAGPPGAMLGFALATGLGQQASEGTPEGWVRSPPRASYVSPGLLGNLAPTPEAWALQRFEALQGPSGTGLELSVRVPEDGEVALSLQHQGSGPLVLLRHGSAQGLWSRGEDSAEPLACSGEAGLGDQTWAVLSLSATPTGFELASPEGTLACSHRPTPGQTRVSGGLGRVLVKELRVDGVQSPPPAPPWWRWAGLAGGLIATLLAAAAQRALGLSLRAVALTLAPLWLCGLLSGSDLGPLYEIARVPGQGGLRLLAAIGPLAMAGVASVWAHLPRLAALPRWRAALACTLVGALGLAWTGALSGSWVTAVYLACAGASVGGLVWLWAHPVRLYNLASLVLVGTTLSSLEMAVRWTEVGRRWDNSRPTGDDGLTRHFEMMEEGAFGGYPGHGFPSTLPPPSGDLRIVCMGGSSTGGAFQNDDLSQFYPARLQERLPGTQVVNQGAGSWTSFHVRLYAERWLEQAQPDIVTVYLGVNEAEYSTTPYAELHEAWLAGRTGGLGPLAGLRLMQGLRFLSLGLRNRGELAVRPAETRENLRVLIQRTHALGGRVLVLTEAAYPSGEPFAAYRAAMEEVAGQEGAAFLDVAPQVLEGGSDMFLDYNHLSDAGHRRLSGQIAEELTQLGWVAEVR